MSLKLDDEQLYGSFGLLPKLQSLVNADLDNFPSAGSGTSSGSDNGAVTNDVDSERQRLLGPSNVASVPIEPPLARRIIACFSVGHVLNDLCAACWFSYLLFYLQNARGLQASEAGIVLLCGQVADAIFTPLVGILTQYTKGFPSLGLGRHKLWISIGTVLVIVDFLAMFVVCLPCEINDRALEDHRAWYIFYYAATASLFNVGWAAVQVCHMSLVPELTRVPDRRVLLNSARYAFTVIANVTIFVLMLVLLSVVGESVSSVLPYRWMAITAVGVGFLTTIMFLIGTPEKEQTRHLSPSPSIVINDDRVESIGSAGSGFYRSAATTQQNQQQQQHQQQHQQHQQQRQQQQQKQQQKQQQQQQQQQQQRSGAKQPRRIATWREWFAVPLFYSVGFAYMCTRLVVNVSQVYLAFYVQYSLQMAEWYVAAAPLTVYLSSLVTSVFLTRRINKWLGRKGAFLFGASCSVVASVSFYFLPSGNLGPVVYPIVALLGVGNATTMVTSVSMETDLIGDNTHTGPFVYGALSFTDKLSNGVAIYVIQQLQPPPVPVKPLGDFIRIVLSAVPGCAAVLACFITLVIRIPVSPHEAAHAAQKAAAKQSKGAKNATMV